MTVSGTHKSSGLIKILSTFEKLAGFHLSLGSNHHYLNAALKVTVLASLSTFMTPISSSSTSIVIFRCVEFAIGGIF